MYYPSLPSCREPLKKFFLLIATKKNVTLPALFNKGGSFMLKKVLIVVGILAVIGVIIVGVAGYGVVKVVDEGIKEKEPEFRQYVKMTVEEQNKYVETHLDSIISGAVKDSKEESSKATFEKIQNDPEAKKIGIECGRAIIASLILSSDAIVADLNEDAKSKLKADADKMSDSMDKYVKILEKYSEKESK